jgi:hypothetical protein
MAAVNHSNGSLSNKSLRPNESNAFIAFFFDHEG